MPFKARTLVLNQRNGILMVKFQARIEVGTSIGELDPGSWGQDRAEGLPQGSLRKWKHHRASWVSHINDLLGESGGGAG